MPHRLLHPITGGLVDPRGRDLKGAIPRPQPNLARISDEEFARFSATLGFDRFFETVQVSATLCSTPGWEDAAGAKTQPGAKPIGMKQWGDAIMVAGKITEAVHGAPWPEPGADTDDAGIILLSWQVAHNAQLDLVLRASLVRKRFQWTPMRDGLRGQAHESNYAREVIASLRAVMVGTERGS